MTKRALSDRPLSGRTFHTIMWVVALIAMIQIFAVSLAMMRRASSDTARAGIVAPSSVPGAAASVAAVIPVVEAIPPVVSGPPQPNRERLSVAQPGIGSGAVVASEPQSNVPLPGAVAVSKSAEMVAPPAALPSEPSFIGPDTPEEPVSLQAALSQAARENVLADEPILERLLATGSELRASGNMQGALQAFREVESALPAHPRVLSELAVTLGQMGLEDKAGVYWESVESLGPVVAGVYFSMAGQQLRGEPFLAPLSPATSTSVAILRIGAVKVEEEVPTSEGQKVTLRVVVETDPGATPVGEDLALLVYFYDQVTGGMVQPSTADTSYLYPTEPYDWLIEGREEIIVSYHQPVLTEDQKRNLGERSYYGYAIELYYRDQIQDKVAMPEDIAKLRVEPAAEPDKDKGVIGPENALFPESVIP